jgi:2-hydroxy-4-carboxymuconate semialdehyde hemiacetal dehydrogenase
MKICLAGQGAFGQRHLKALKNVDDVEVVTLAGGSPETTEKVAKEWGIPHWSTDLGECLEQPGVEAAILTTPTQLHAQQGIQCMRAGKHVMIEIPMADNRADSEELVKVQKETGLVAMAGHTRRFNPSHQWVHNRIDKGELNIQQMQVRTHFFRRENKNALGQPRSWTDHLWWHHACHTVDLFRYQAQEPVETVYAVQGPEHPELGIAMDMGILMKTGSGKICVLSLSFNNDGPLGTWFRYICDNGTYIARYDELVDGHENQIDLSNVDVSMDGVELQDREFINAIKENREPNASVGQALPAMQLLDEIEKHLQTQR